MSPGLLEGEGLVDVDLELAACHERCDAVEQCRVLHGPYGLVLGTPPNQAHDESALAISSPVSAWCLSQSSSSLGGLTWMTGNSRHSSDQRSMAV